MKFKVSLFYPLFSVWSFIFHFNLFFSKKNIYNLMLIWIKKLNYAKTKLGERGHCIFNSNSNITTRLSFFFFILIEQTSIIKRASEIWWFGCFVHVYNRPFPIDLIIASIWSRHEKLHLLLFRARSPVIQLYVAGR
jgi:hypothetical protein